MDKKYLFDVAEFNVARAWARFAKVFPQIRSYPLPQIKFNARLKTTAGRAWFDEHVVEFSPELMWEHTTYFVENTVPHEIGHLVAAIVVGDYGHGKGWKDVMRMAGYPCNRCHSMVNSKHEARKAKAI